LERSWFAAQIARFTAAGASCGAAAWPKRSLALVPGTVGPEEGKGLAIADETSAPKNAMPNKVFKIREYTERLGALAVPEISQIRRKNQWDAVSK
jgi:hypothetical protein